MFLRLLTLTTLAMNSVATITDCSNGKSLFSIQGLGFWPDPAVKNSNSTISFAYTVPEPGFSGGTATYAATYNFLPITPTVEDLCKNVACPILPGPYNMSTSSTFPDLSGSLTIKLVWKDLTGAQLLCALIKTKVV
jgi:hypothetical protein